MIGQLDDNQVLRAMHEAGLPRIFRDKSVILANEGPTGERLAKWIGGTDIYPEISGGYGRIFKGDDERIMRLFFLTARGLLLRGIGVVIYTLHRFVREMEEVGEETFMEQLQQELDGTDKSVRGTLFISGFNPDKWKEPMPENRMSRAEWFFRDLLYDGRALFVQVHATAPPLWSNSFNKLLAERSPEVTV